MLLRGMISTTTLLSRGDPGQVVSVGSRLTTRHMGNHSKATETGRTIAT